jgi:mannose-6-phosphate isomerase
VTVLLARLEGALRDYAWGSRRFLAELEGRPSPSASPEAERWFGAHPTGPATLRLADGTARPLDAAIADDPLGMLGSDVVARFGPRLPFLLKVLAAAEPLSLQAHPSAARAQAGFADEEAQGIPLDAAHRRYRDSWPKPELLRALTPFTALCGFRALDRTLDLLATLGVDELAWLADGLRAGGEAAIAPAVRRLLTLPPTERGPVVAAVAAHAAALTEDADWGAEARMVRALAVRYPDDPGVVVALLMHLLQLAPGDALHLSAGNLHAHLEGVGIEVMATSDNVLRGGLTAKHVDVDELLQVLDDRAGTVPQVTPVAGVPGERVLPVPTPFFRLSELAPSPGAVVALDRRGPQVLLCTSGRTTIAADGTSLTLARGQAVFTAAAAHDVQVTATGDPDDVLVFRATVGDARG